jgi:hypothetical protein
VYCRLVTFPSWKEAMPYALQLARGYARTVPIQIDAEALALEALWKAHLGGAEFSKAYVRLRVIGALKDELRRLTPGSRASGYLTPSQFCDVDHSPIAGPAVDPEDALDAKSRWQSLPTAARYLTQRLVESPRSELALELSVTEGRIDQVAAQLASCPDTVVRVPGRVDLRQELEWSKQDVLRRRAKGTVTQAATALGTSRQNAWRWMGPDSPQPQFMTGQGAVNERLRRRCRELLTTALGRTNGSVPQAAKILGMPQMTARRWAQALVPELLKDTRRNPTVSTEEILRLRETGLTAYAIAKQLGVSKGLVKWRLQGAELKAALGNRQQVPGRSEP